MLVWGSLKSQRARMETKGCRYPPLSIQLSSDTCVSIPLTTKMPSPPFRQMPILWIRPLSLRPWLSTLIGDDWVAGCPGEEEWMEEISTIYSNSYYKWPALAVQKEWSRSILIFRWRRYSG